MNYIIFDLESTCWEDNTLKQREIIEIGAVKLNESLMVVDEFQAFVKPKLYPDLSDFCKSLTSIQQADVENAYPFPEVIENFKQWIMKSGEDYILCSWGFYDKKQTKQDCELHNLDTEWINKHISIKHKFEELLGNGIKIEVPKALKVLNIPLEGTYHRGIDDAKNIAKIFVKVFDKLNI